MSYNCQIQKIESKTLVNEGLVAGMYDELGIGDIIDEAIEQDEEKRSVSLDEAVKADVTLSPGYHEHYYPKMCLMSKYLNLWNYRR